jgi:hypothetical protein
MKRLAAIAIVILVFTPASCTSNTAPGNDREAQLDPAAPAAEIAQADAAIAGVETSLLHPEIMTDADLASIAAAPEQCLFRFTKVGLPVFVYRETGEAGTIKLNGKLVPLPSGGQGSFASGPVRVQLRVIEADAEPEDQRLAELVLMLTGARDELGYRGFAECAAG